jgi:pilus assembly protein CpaB
MWKVKRMNTARIIVLTTAPRAGGIAAFPGSDHTPAPTEPVARLQAAGEFVATYAIGPGRAVKPTRTPEGKAA